MQKGMVIAMKRHIGKHKNAAGIFSGKIGLTVLSIVLAAAVLFGSACSNRQIIKSPQAGNKPSSSLNAKEPVRSREVDLAFESGAAADSEPSAEIGTDAAINSGQSVKIKSDAALNTQLLAKVGTEARTGPAARPAAEAEAAPVDLKGLVIIAKDSSRALIDGEYVDLVAEMPGLSAYISNGRTYAPVDFFKKCFGLSYIHNEEKGSLRFKKGGAIVATLNSREYDYATVNYTDIILYAPLRKVTEALGKSVSYYGGLIVVGDRVSPFDPAGDAAQLSEIRAELTGAIPVGTSEKFQKLMLSGEQYVFGPYENRLNEIKNMKARGYYKEGFALNETTGADLMFDMAMPQLGAVVAEEERKEDSAAGGFGGADGSASNAPPPSGRSSSMATTAAATTAAALPKEAPMPSMAPDKAADADGNAKASAAGADDDEFSRTNIQVEGVDESDVVKTDGRYIYQVNNRRILIVDAYPPSGMKIVGKIEFDKSAVARTDVFEPIEMYVDADTLVVIGSSIREMPVPKPRVQTGAKDITGVARDVVAVEEYYPGYSVGSRTTRVLVYDMKDRANLKLLRDTEIEGDYRTSRKIGGALYLIANKPFYFYKPFYAGYVDDFSRDAVPAGVEPESDDTPRAAYSDSATTKGEFVDMDYSKVYYFPGCVSNNYMIVAGIDTRNADAPISVESILDYGQNVYVSHNYMYVATQKYNRYGFWGEDFTQTTSVHRFKLNGGAVVYDGKGEVNGYVLNQFSMDQSGEYLRIATTSESYKQSRGYVLQNNLYVLDAGLKVVGSLEGLAPGENIYSVRFIGSRGYVVTFKTVDPLFVIDLADPKSPKVLGALKIPGYSDYLHPYDENHVIGFGKDTVEFKTQWSDSSAAFYQGIKIALFDVTDVENPKEKFKTSIGDRGTDSELLRNHKALLFSKERELLAFPVTLMTVPDSRKTGNIKNDSLAYGQFEFQGAYVYNLNLKDGFVLKGRITHISPDEYKMYGSDFWWGDEKAIDRLLYIKESLYALSKAFISSSKIETPGIETNRISLK